MKFIVTFVLFLSVSLSARSHEYFFGFAELSYNQSSTRYEGTLMLSTHETEEWFQNKKLSVQELEDHVADREIISQMEKLLFAGFAVNANGKKMEFTILGYEVLTTGMTHFYFHSSPVDLATDFDIFFDLLMDEAPAQQNKLTIRNDKESKVAVFTLLKKNSSIRFE